MKGIYLVGCYPDADTFTRSFAAVAEAGFDFLEVGIPFNDPIADGPVIAGAIHESLARGVSPSHVMENIESLSHIPIKKYAMTYANIIHAYGIPEFSKRMTGLLEGVIIPDIPNRMARLFREKGFSLPIVPFATLETRESDMAMLNESESNIIYFVGVRGITGSKSDFTTPELVEKIRMIKDNTDKKVIIGFGIKTGSDARQACALGDGYVVGTEAVMRQKKPEALKAYLRSLI
ncbi:MAG: tryptophan synthase subunit alpha [Spirochaetes bacterium]|nr:tryptophan synthase subunit alpha [Spirochaetota bacterium]